MPQNSVKKGKIRNRRQMEADSKRTSFTPCSICPPPAFKCPGIGRFHAASGKGAGGTGKQAGNPSPSASEWRSDPASREAQLRRSALARCLGLVSGGTLKALLDSATALHRILQGALETGSSGCFVAGTTEHETRSITGRLRPRKE